MFNVNQFYINLDNLKKQHSSILNQGKVTQLYNKRRDKLAYNYKKRVDQFIIEMAYEPIIQGEHIKPLDCTRRPEPRIDDFKGGPFFIMRGYRSEKERIQESIENNSFIDSGGACWGKLNLRPRDENKEINPRMRFQARTGIERVMDVVKNYQGSYLNLKKKDSKAQFTTDQSKQSKLSSKQDSKLKQNALTILDMLHKKTHFKAVQTISLGGHFGSLTSKNQDQKKQISNISQQGQRPTSKESNITADKVRTSPTSKQQQNQLDLGSNKKMDITVPLTQEEIIKHATQVLVDCKVQKHNKMPMLEKGAGKLFGTSEWNNHEFHKKVLPNYKKLSSTPKQNVTFYL